ncbi:MAG: ATP-dependent DNA helicase RecG [Cytophagales bacterium]|nr:ATP-dependent DNA helicase RecG [Cytophagales bacterium]
MTNFFDTKIEFLKGVGPHKAALLNKELKIFTFADLIQFYPFRYEDRTEFYKISEVTQQIRSLADSMPLLQIKGKIRYLNTIGQRKQKRLVANFFDDTGEIELVWFRGLQWINLKPNVEYVIFGKPTLYNNKINIAHPEYELFESNEKSGYIQPVYHTTERLSSRFLGSKAIAKLQERLIELAKPQIRETLTEHIINSFSLISKKDALSNIHFPKDHDLLKKAGFRLKFEELFYIQLGLLMNKRKRKAELSGQIFKHVPTLNDFYHHHLPFQLTNAQKKVIKEIYTDMSSGRQMNRLLQGDVGSGKTIVAFIASLTAIDNNAQSCLMAPTEILAEQHYNVLKKYADKLGLNIGKLTGSTKKSERKILFEQLSSGDLNIIVGTHALLEEQVQFKNLGFCIIDEQHRFGVAQRARLWEKSSSSSGSGKVYPHILVMTATPIPRTLAMTLYGDLDTSVIDEMPPGRKPVTTVHRYDKSRLRVFGFLKEQIKKGRQAYIVYPLIEESEKMDYKDLIDGYESIRQAFPEYHVSMVHGRMNPKDKEFEMQRFVKGETKIMVATTVIEVGVDIPNASVMIIESAERFGLSTLHQLRGRVGRGADQSYCILMTGYKLSSESRTRIETMVRTNNGFEIADIDLKLRGPGNLMGTQQSGVLDLLIADLAQDAAILQTARQAAQYLLVKDPSLQNPENHNIQKHISSLKKNTVNWSRIS